MQPALPNQDFEILMSSSAADLHMVLLNYYAVGMDHVFGY
jgi:hypothetical protein